MKYTIARKSSLNKEKYKIICDSKSLCSGKVTHSKECKGQYNVKLTNPINKHIGENSCFIQPDPQQPQGYLIYLTNDKTKENKLFGQLMYKYIGYNNNLYTIIIGQKLYQVRSCDLKDRRLAIVDTVRSYSPETLFEVTDPFSKSNKKYHVIINDKESQCGYLAFVILLDLHEFKRNNF